MQGVVFKGNRELEIMTFDDPVPGANEVVVEIKASGFCGSDLHHYRGEPGASLRLRSEAFLAERGMTHDTPVIAGHEPCGVVVALGKSVDSSAFRVGDRVMVYHYDGCNYCDQCRTGWVQMCNKGSTVYGQTGHGGHAHYMKVPARALIHMPDEISYMAGAAISCGTGTAFGTIERLDLSARDTLAVFGLGPVGLSALQLAQAMGIMTFAVDISAERVAQAKDFGATVAINSTLDDPIDMILGLTRGKGATASIDCSGAAAARQAAIRSTQTWGRTALVGIGAGLNLDVTADLILKQRTLIGHLTFSDVSMERCVQFVADHGINLDKQFTQQWRLEDAKIAYQDFDRQVGGKAAFIF